MRNVELKARLSDPEAARSAARSIATKWLGVQQQIDTYFYCNRGRLKLRQIEGSSAQLIWYARSDEQGPRQSDYQLVPVSNPETLKAALRAALGVRAVVRKRREIFLVDTVRVHLDEVAGLGHFLEFEAVMGPGIDEAAGRARLEGLIKTFAVASEDLVSTSYGDMLG